MANRMREPVGYQPFRMNPVLDTSRIEQPTFGGDLWYRTADALAKAAGVFGQRAKAEQAAAQDQRDLQEALASSSGTTAINGGAMPSIGAGDLSAAIDAAAAKHGVSAETLRGVAYLESRGKTDAYNAGSKAAGPFQFIPSTAKQYGLANPYDPAQASDAAARLLKDNRDYLAKALGREPSAGELYLAHQQGAGGAAKLLKNPDAVASNVVPLQHILSNGGRADMTAGEFASLWTNRMGGAPSVSRSAPGVASSNPEHPFGKYAVDYWQRIRVSIDKDLNEIESRFGDDPAAMTQAIGDLRKAYQPQVFPEIQADFDAAWQSATAPMLKQAGDRAEKKLTAEEQATFLSNVEQSEANRDRAVESFVPGSDAGLADLHRRQSEIDAQYDEGAKRGYITPLQAIDAKTKSRRATVTRFYERQAEALATPEDVAALRTRFHEDYAAGKLDGMDQQGWDALDSRMVAIENKKRTDGVIADNAIKTRADDLAARVAAGGDASPADLNKLSIDAKTAPNGAAIVDGVTAKIDVARTLRDLPVDQAEAKINKMFADLPADASTQQLEAIQFGRQQVQRTRTMLAKDPLGLAVERGVVPDVPAIDFSGNVEASTMAGSIADRVAKARAVADHYGVSPRYLRPGEAKDLANLLKTDPDAVASALSGIVGGSASAAPDILNEISENSQAVADAGRLLLSGGAGSTALDLLRGASKSPDGKEWKSIKPEVQAPWAAETMGNAFEAMPDEMRRLKSSAALIARYRLAEAGLLPDDSGAEDIYKQAINEAAGATFVGAHQYGGIADVDRPGMWSGSDQVRVPSDVDAARFSDLLDAIRDGDLNSRPTLEDGTPVTWGEIRGSRPVAVDGGYVFVLGDQTGGSGRMFRNADGTPWVLDLEGLLPTLAKRTVGAVRGY